MKSYLKSDRRSLNKPDSIYLKFGEYYDNLYDNFIDYPSDCDFIEDIFKEHHEGLDRGSERQCLKILDLGCGTGNHALELARRGHFITGVDISRTSLSSAQAKLAGSSKAVSSVHFIRQDLRRIAFKIEFDCAIALFGVLSYIHDGSDLSNIFSRVRSHLKPGGLFMGEIWQFSGVLPGFKHRTSGRDESRKLEVIRNSESRTAYARDVMEIQMDFEVKELKNSKTIDSFTEYHYLHAYDLDKFKKHLESAGFEFIGYYSADSNLKDRKPISKETLRSFFISQKATNNTFT